MLRESNAAVDVQDGVDEAEGEAPANPTWHERRRKIKDGIRCGRCKWVRFKFMPACPKCAYVRPLEFDTALGSDVMREKPRRKVTRVGDAAPAATVYREPIRSTSRCNDDPPPERAFFEALLREAIECLAGRGVLTGAYSARSRVLQRQLLRDQAKAWVLSNLRTPVTAFVPTCETLGLDPQATRRVLLGVAYAEQELRGLVS